MAASDPVPRADFEHLKARMQKLEKWQEEMQNNACATAADRSQHRGSVAAPVGSCLASQSHFLAAGAEHSSLDSQGLPFPSVGLPPFSRTAFPEGAQWSGSTSQGGAPLRKRPRLKVRGTVGEPILKTATQEMLTRLKEEGTQRGYSALFSFIGEQLGADGGTGASGTTLDHICKNVRKRDRPKRKDKLKALLMEAGLEIKTQDGYEEMVVDPIYFDVTSANATAC